MACAEKVGIGIEFLTAGVIIAYNGMDPIADRRSSGFL